MKRPKSNYINNAKRMVGGNQTTFTDVTLD
jgi:hypothetical protein